MWSDPRSRRFRARTHGRYWWFHGIGRDDYVPPVFAELTRAEWRVMRDWYAATDRDDKAGEMNVPLISLLHGLVGGNRIERIVQLGHYSGYSTLLIGMWLRRMGAAARLASVDIDAGVTAYTQAWVDKARLRPWVDLIVGDSAAPAALDACLANLGGPPRLIVLDSSHQYGHTVRELDLWAPTLPVGGLIVLHDTSAFAAQYDSTGHGGAGRAAAEWSAGRDGWAYLSLNGHAEVGARLEDLTYADACGVGILQRQG